MLMATFKKIREMNNRSTNLLSLRPEIPSARITDDMSKDERFQNQTLRPIIKLQNLLIISVFKNYIGKHKNRFYELTLQKRIEYIENAVQKDIKFRNSLKGLIIGQFTVEEYETYIQNSSALNKRMMNMVIERLKDQIQLLELAALVQ
ncbi:MAG: hypothetical protein ACI8VZ_000857 [Candidatus Paceibacteria bacterium]|jgi:hypothetical protein